MLRDKRCDTKEGGVIYMQIDGHTAVLVHLAYPAAHLQTPRHFNRRCKERGVNAVLVPWQVHPDNLATTMDALRQAENLAGIIVTIPHKETCAQLCDRLEGVADFLGVANVIRREADGSLTGRILDGQGFVEGLCHMDVKIAGRQVLIAGAGGVALAIAAALLDAGASKISIVNRTRSRAEMMVQRLRKYAANVGLEATVTVAADSDPTGYDIVINATALGMHADDALPFPVCKITAQMVVAEVVMAPSITPLLHAAASNGAKTVPGAAMITGQINPFIDFVLGTTANSGGPNQLSGD